MIDENLEYILNLAIRKANERRHEYLTLENVFWALLHDSTIVQVLKQCHGDVDLIKKEALEYLQDDSQFSILSQEDIKRKHHQQFQSEDLKQRAIENGIMYQPELGLSLQRVIQRSALHVQSAGKNRISVVNFLVAMYSEKESYAVYLLEKQNISRMLVIEQVAHGVDKAQTSLLRPHESPGHAGQKSENQEQKEHNQSDLSKILSEYTENINELYRQGKIDPIVGREEELERMIQILSRRRKNNPLIVGDAGVGKTALLNGLAQAIESGKVPSYLQKATIYSLDMVSLLAGTKFRGEFEERLKWVIQALKNYNGEDHLAADEEGDEKDEIIIRKEKIKPLKILFIDEIHTIIGAGATNSGSLDASNLLKPALMTGELRCIGSTTFKEYRRFMEKDQALTRRFQKIEVEEPSVDETIKILEGLKSKFEDHHGVTYSHGVLKAAVELSRRYMTDKKLPDKAIDIIDEAGAVLQIKRDHGKNEDQKVKKMKVTLKHIEEIVAVMAKIPLKTVSLDEKEKLKNLESQLKLLIFGQDQAIEKVVEQILSARSGLTTLQRPLANFLFTGPTGVGKTELAKQLAFIMGIHFERFDMSEFMEKHSVSKLIGAPPGYVGYEQGGKLTDVIMKYPHCVLLLDEIEKAHPDIFNILLQVMDYGTLTDSNGRVTDFKNVILVMTSNAGAQQAEQGSINLSGHQTQQQQSKRDKAIKEYFSPEFRNRLDGVIHFQKLTDDQLEKIVEKFLMELVQLLHEKKVELTYDRDVLLWIGKKGFDEKLGARPVQRILNEKVKNVLSREILFGKLEKGGSIHLKINNGELVFE